MDISDKSHRYLRHISGIYHGYLRHLSGISQAYFRHIAGISQAYCRHISGIYLAYLWLISGLSQLSSYIIYLKHISGISKYSLTTKYHSLILIRLFITFIDTEIFAAYAGSCLFLLLACLTAAQQILPSGLVVFTVLIGQYWSRFNLAIKLNLSTMSETSAPS